MMKKLPPYVYKPLHAKGMFDLEPLCTHEFVHSLGGITIDNPEYNEIITSFRKQTDISAYYLALLKNNEIDIVIDHSVEGWYYINWQLVYDVFQIVPSQLTWVTSNLNVTQMNQGWEHTILYKNYWEYSLRDSLALEEIDQREKYKIQLSKLINKTNRVYDATLYASRPRVTRAAALILLHHNKIIDRMIWSWGGNTFGALHKYKGTMDGYFEFGTYDRSSAWLTKQGIVIPDENENFLTLNSLQINWNQVYNTRYQIIQETMVEEFAVSPSLFLSEKSYKPFACGQPALWWAEAGNVDALRQAGYDVYDKWFDHSYDTIENSTDRIVAIVKEAKRLSEINEVEWENMLIEMLPTIKRNYETFSQVTPIIETTVTF